MFEPKFTVGPWHCGCLGGDTHCQCRTILSEGYMGGIAQVYVDNGIESISDGGNDCPTLEEAIANMRLIAAAPCMFSALDGLLIALSTGNGIAEATDNAKAAMRRATQGDK